MKKSEALMARALALMPGGVNSPVRSFSAVGGSPPFIKSASGAIVTDEDGQTYIDFLGSWGPLILGHSHPAVVEAVCKAAERGLSFGACHAGEVRLAELIHESMPHVEMLRLVCSGTEGAMSALRLARGATGKNVVIKFEGCYHGHADSFLVGAGSGALTFGTPSSPGVTPGAAGDTLLASYNDVASVERLFDARPGEVACVIVEPVAGNMGVVPPRAGFLLSLRELCDRNGALLIFDEVITGFRVSPGGASLLYSVTPDLVVLGKIIGGGMPVGAYGGRKDLMKQISPDGPVYQAGTLAGNPIATAAGVATLEILANESPYSRLSAMARKMSEGTRANLEATGATGVMNSVASMGTLFFGVGEVGNFGDAKQADTELYSRYHAAMLARGVYLAPSQFEAAFISTAHEEQHISRALDIQREALEEVINEASA